MRVTVNTQPSKTMKTQVASELPLKETYYKTARATVSCAHFKAGDIVSVKFAGIGGNGVAWYNIDRTQHGALDQVVAYPEHHLAEFCL